MATNIEYEDVELSAQDLKQLQVIAEDAAVRSIVAWWRYHHNRAVFFHMKAALAEAGDAIAGEVLKQLCPREASLLSDPTIEPVVRFRFAGVSFPPMVVFKVYLTSTNTKVIYISGRKMIKPGSDAAVDSYTQMGRRKFVDQMLMDSMQRAKLGVTDELDISTMKEYMQYASAVDSQPAQLGGRDNGWRTLEPTAQHGVLFDFMTYFHGADPTERLLRQIPNLREEESISEQERKLRVLQERSMKASQALTGKNKVSGKMTKRTRNKRISHMRTLYGLDQRNHLTDTSREDTGGLSTTVDLNTFIDSTRLDYNGRDNNNHTVTNGRTNNNHTDIISDSDGGYLNNSYTNTNDSRSELDQHHYNINNNTISNNDSNYNDNNDNSSSSSSTTAYNSNNNNNNNYITTTNNNNTTTNNYTNNSSNARTFDYEEDVDDDEDVGALFQWSQALSIDDDDIIDDD